MHLDKSGLKVLHHKNDFYDLINYKLYYYFVHKNFFFKYFYLKRLQ